MRRRSRWYRVSVPILLPLLTGVFLLLLDARGVPFLEPAPEAPVLDQASLPRSPGDGLPDLTPPYREAARHLSGGNCDAALERLSPLTAPEAGDAPFARLVRGLYASACDRPHTALELLFLGGGRGSALEDWRLLVLGEVASELGEEAVSRAALDKILEGYPDSPLWFRALERAALQAREAGDPARLLALAERAAPDSGSGSEAGTPEPTGPSPADTVPSEVRTALDTLAWKVAEEHDLPEVRRAVARRLLVRSPELAESLGVVEIFEAEKAGEGWLGDLLTPADLTRRARALAELRRYDDALAALELVPESRRDDDQRLLAASIQTRAHRGDLALGILAGIDADDLREASEVEWQKALATRDLSVARRGRTNLPAARREALRRASLEHLRRVAALDGDRDLTLTALRTLFYRTADEEPFEVTRGILERLRALEPEDTTGAEHLWRQGWNAFQRRNWSGAIGWWAELAALYPDHRSSRSGRYWTGRAFEALGQGDRAQEIFRQVASSDTTDFYRRYALARLDPSADPKAGRVPGREPRPWPEDPALARAYLLADLELEGLALMELEGVRARWRARGQPALDPRAADALESELLHRTGRVRASIGPIRRAFPALGGPYQAGVPEKALRLYYPLAFEEEVREQAERFDLPVEVLLGMVRQESGFDPSAYSRAGARGLLQLMPATGREVARRMGLRWSSRRLGDPSFNLRLGAAYFHQMMSMFGGRLELALAGYNGGPYRIKRLWRRAGRRDLDHFVEDLPVAESQIYVKRILLLSDSYRQLYDLDGERRMAARSAGVPSSPAAASPSDPSVATAAAASAR